MMNHPLALLDSDESNDGDERSTPAVTECMRLRNVRDSSPSTVSATSGSGEHPNVHQSADSTNKIAELDSQTVALANLIRTKCAVKRIAPKRPPPPPPQLPPLPAQPPVAVAPPVCSIDSEFLIPVEMVRWFFKSEKEKHHSHNAANPTSDSAKSVPVSNENAQISSDQNNNPNQVGNKITVVS